MNNIHRYDCSDDAGSLERARARSAAEENNDNYHNGCSSVPCKATKQENSNNISSNNDDINNINHNNNTNINNNYINNHNYTVSDKKTVRFNNTTVYRLHDVPPASDMTPQEKQTTWHASDEYDQFKAEAAECAGVRIIPPHGQDRHFVMMGDFDGREGKMPDSASSGLSTGRRHYNENEYNDRISPDGRYMCRRGLGYHFSRGRRGGKAAARSAVVAWQKALRDGQSDDQRWERNLAAINREFVAKQRRPLENSETILALVSTRCSRVALEEARWRGEADHRAAYPELCDAASEKNMRQHSRKRRGKGSAAPAIAKKMKRRGGEVFHAGILNEGSDSGFKRRRIASGRPSRDGGCGSSYSSGSDGDAPSPATMGHYLNGVFEVQV